MKSIKSGRKLALSASKDFIFSVLALMIYNGVLQLVIYPGLEQQVGATAFGTVLYFISIVSVMGAGFGTAASYSRMMAKKDRTQANGDYNTFLIIVAIIAVPVTAVTMHFAGSLQLSLFIQVLALMVITVFRYYADVQYRMDIRFRDYFIFFTLVSVGYVVGLLLYPVLKSWVMVLALGEVAGIIFTICSGRIFRSPFLQTSDSFKENMKSVWYISASNLLAALILHSDRILLRLLVGEKEVTVFYTASLIGKIVALLTTPLNGVMISYLTNYDFQFNKKRFGRIAAAFMGVSVVGALACTGVSYIFVKLFYPDVFTEAASYFFLANLGQILYFISGSLMVVILSFTKERVQLVINVIYAVSFVVIVIPMTLKFGLIGIAYGLIAVNVIRFMATTVLGLKAFNVITFIP